MKINKRILNYSLWLSLLTILIFPGNLFTEDTKGMRYGFPFPFLIHYHQDHWFIRGVSINILYYLIDIIIIYFIIIGLREIYRRIK